VNCVTLWSCSIFLIFLEHCVSSRGFWELFKSFVCIAWLIFQWSLQIDLTSHIIKVYLTLKVTPPHSCSFENNSIFFCCQFEYL
jgi:hypothetical protein